MKPVIAVGLLGSTLFALAGCTTYVTRGEHTLSIAAPDKVNRGEIFSFTVTVKDASGQEVPKAVYHWSVDWVGVEGIKHKGRTGIAQHIRVKGSPGAAVLHVLGYDTNDNFGEIATHPFQIE